MTRQTEALITHNLNKKDQTYGDTVSDLIDKFNRFEGMKWNSVKNTLINDYFGPFFEKFVVFSI